MRAALVISATLALAACAESKAPPPMVKERACSVLDPYTGRVSNIKPDDARVWTAGTNAALAELCKGETK